MEDGGEGVGRGQDARAPPRICAPASRTISRYWVPSSPGRRSKSWASGSSSMKGKWWKATGWASTSKRPRRAPSPSAGRSPCGCRAGAARRGRPRSARPGRRPGRACASASAAATGVVAAQVAKVDRALQRDHPVKGLCHVGAPPRCRARPLPAVCMPGGRTGTSANSGDTPSGHRHVPQGEPPGQVGLDRQVGAHHGPDAQLQLGVAALLLASTGAKG